MPLRVNSAAELGAVLRETRTGLKIHAADLAIIADMSPTTLRRLESGNPTSAVLSLLVLLDELGIELYLSPPPDLPPVVLPPAGTAPKRRRVSA